MSLIHYKGTQPAHSHPVLNAQRIGIFSPGRGDHTFHLEDGRTREITVFEVAGTTIVRDVLLAHGCRQEPILRA